MRTVGLVAVVLAVGCGAAVARPTVSGHTDVTPPAPIDLTAYGPAVLDAARALEGTDVALAHERVAALAPANPPPFAYLAARLLHREGYPMLAAALLGARTGDAAIDAEALRWLVFLARVEPALIPTLEGQLGNVSEDERTALYASLDPDGARSALVLAARATCGPSSDASATCASTESDGATALDAERRLRAALFRLHTGELDAADAMLAAAAHDPASTPALRAFATLVYGHVSVLRAETAAPTVYDSDQLLGDVASEHAHRAIDAWSTVVDDPTYGTIARTAVALLALRIREPRRALTAIAGLSLASDRVPSEVVWIRGRASASLCLDSATADARMTREEALVAARAEAMRVLVEPLADETVLAYEASLESLAAEWPAPGSRGAALVDAAVASEQRPRLEARELAWGDHEGAHWFSLPGATLRDRRAALAALTTEVARVRDRAQPDPWLEQLALLAASFARDELASAVRSRLVRDAEDAADDVSGPDTSFLENLHGYFRASDPSECHAATTATDLPSIPNDP